MIEDTTSLPGYNVLRDEAGDAPPVLTGQDTIHPLDPLSVQEIRAASTAIRHHAQGKRLKFNCITLRNPDKREYTAFRMCRAPRPPRRALAIVLENGTSAVAEVIVNLGPQCIIESWKAVPDVAPTLTLEDLDVTERIARTDARVIQTCHQIGIDNMEEVYFDAWAIGFDHRWGFERRLQQGLAYWRASPTDNQYAHPLDFSVVVDTESEEILAIDIRDGDRSSYDSNRLKPIDITQPAGVSFKVRGKELSWAGFKMHIGFNYREGIVLSDVRVTDQHNDNRERTLFNRISVVEMVVPYGHPEAPHHRKHAFDVGEYGSGLMTNSLKLGCDCKGAIYYMDAVMSTARGDPAVVKNAICIHEEDNGLLYKHTDFRDGSVISARDRRLIISQIITAANYEYGFYHTFSLDGTYKLEMKLTGMLNTYCLRPSESAMPFGAQIAEGLTAHNHQHIFSLRVDPEIDGPNNSVVQNDAIPSEAPVGSKENPYGNGFYCKKTPLETSMQAATNYSSDTSRSWDIVNPGSINPATKRPVGYKILNNNSPPLLAKPGSVLYNRAAFARKNLWVVPYRDHEIFPAGNYVCQSTGKTHQQNQSVADWAARDECITDTDLVCYIQFGLTHFPRTEDFPIMPAEPVSVMLRASNFFEKNPAMWVPPSTLAIDKSSKHAFEKGAYCCNERDTGVSRL